MAHGQFEFRGIGGSYFWLLIWTSLLTAITFGLFFPWAITAIQQWIAKNTHIDGKRLVFKGTGGGFFGNYLLVWLLTIITFGIYSPWGFCRIQRWIVNNTYFADEGDIEE